ncbi:MAG: HAD-IA family hydrolase [Gemmataceae bacterium]
MPIRAALFDFDGTLADSFAAIAASTNHTRTTYGLPSLTEAEIRSHVGHGLAHLLKDLVPTAPSVEQAIKTYRDHHETIAIQQTKLLPGVRETIDALHEHGIRLGVCSNKAVHFTKALTASLFPKGEFKVVMGPEDVARPKPDPAMLLVACERLGVQIAETVYVGDMSVDVLTGKAAGITTWLVPGGAGHWDEAVAAAPDRILKSFDEVLKGCLS